MLEQVMADNGFPVPLVEGGNCRVFQFHSGTGEGIMTQYDLFPGVSLMYNDFHMESYDSAFRTTEDLLCIDYCRQGRMEYPAGPDAYSYVEAGDLKLDRRLEHQGHFTFPLAHYHGITVGFALPQAAQSLKEWIRIKNEFGFVPWNCLHLFALRAASVGLVLAAGQQALAGALPLPYFLMIALFSFTIFGSVEAINDAAHILSVTDSVLDRLEELEHTDFIDKGGKEVTPERFDVSLSHVSFGYGSREVLHDVTFTAPQGTTTAIVGPSGSGKSTICNLVARFYDADRGSVSVGGHDVKEFTCESLLKNISMVFQNVYLFQDSVENNIKFGCPDATHEQVVAAAKAACCHDFISALPNGYGTVIGEGGSTLSGGEKQRISIARAILKDAPIVILDEATASVDPENEHLIQQALSALTKGKTILTIAHRLATIQHADQILVVEDGRIAQRGTHAELMAQGGLYRRFIEIREQAEGWRLA